MIALDTITAADIATGAVGSAEITNNSVQALDLADEPGLEYGSSFTNLDPTNAWQTAATINISWPAAGFLVTIAEFQVSCSAESNVQARIELAGLGLTSPSWVRTVPVVGNYAIMNTQFVASVGSSGSSDVNLGIATLPDNCNYFRVLSLATMYFPTRY